MTSRLMSVLILAGCAFGIWFLLTNQSGAPQPREFCSTVEACPTEVW